MTTSGRPLEEYCRKATASGATDALVTDPARVVTAPWVRWKCQFGCEGYGKSHCCPPYTPTPEQTRQTLDSYDRALLFHLEWARPQSGKAIKNYLDMVVDMEIEMFLDGFYRAFALLAGPCFNCRNGCAITENKPCNFPMRARPAMEACGIDVFQTARNHGLPLSPLRDELELRHLYCLVLVD